MNEHLTQALADYEQAYKALMVTAGVLPPPQIAMGLVLAARLAMIAHKLDIVGNQLAMLDVADRYPAR